MDSSESDYEYITLRISDGGSTGDEDRTYERMSDPEATTEVPPVESEGVSQDENVEDLKKQTAVENAQNGAAAAAADSPSETKTADDSPTETPLIAKVCAKPEAEPLIVSSSTAPPSGKRSNCRCGSAILEQVPYLMGVVLYFGLVYGRFLMLNDVTPEMVPDMGARFSYVLTNSLIAFIPVVAAMAFQQWSTNPNHATFARSSFDLTILLLINCLIMSTYTDCSTMKLIPAILQMFMVFRLFNWVSLGCRPSIQHFTGSPALVTNTAMLVFSLYMLFCQEYVGTYIHGAPPPSPEPPARDEDVTNSWF